MSLGFLVAAVLQLQWSEATLFRCSQKTTLNISLGGVNAFSNFITVLGSVNSNRLKSNITKSTLCVLFLISGVGSFWMW
jgi:hypothetical protein